MTDIKFTIAQNLLNALSIQKRKREVVFEQTGSQLLVKAGEFRKAYRDKNKVESFEFNVFDLLGWPNENLHSKLLAFLLNPHESHGQGNLFLKHFLLNLGIENPDSQNWAVTYEKGRIDILLVRRNPHSIIIIENKSNGAVDQPSQLYRYWYYQIHKSKQAIDYTSDVYQKRYQILYLTPNFKKSPVDDSLCKPDSFRNLKDFAALPNQVPIKPKIWEFSVDVAKFLEDALRDNLKDNHRFRTYLEQYLELIKNLK